MASNFKLTPINGLYELDSNPHFDSRGSFLNIFSNQDEVFCTHWALRQIAQVNISKTELIGTIRGLHMQSAPHSEAKIVHCIRGKVWDVVVDLRINSTSFRQWHAVELSPLSTTAFLIPEGCAHGFQVLESCSELLYLHSQDWFPDAETGIRWDDPSLAINWPLPVSRISSRDQALPFLNNL